jgi:hypothetical protein
MLNIPPKFVTCTEEVNAIYEDNGSSREKDKPKKTVPQNLTPVTIMVVDTISSVRSRTMDNFPGWSYLPGQNPGRISKIKLGTLPS